jgi:hypothetical protein
MRNVELVRWKRGMQKVSCTQALQAFCGLGLSAAKAATDALLEHQRPIVSTRSDSTARQLIVELASLGVAARFAEGEDYAPQERFESLLVQVASVLPSPSLVSCRALAAHGEWEIALSHCISALRSSNLQVSAAIEGLLSELVVEFGLAASALPQNGA